jgi:hypothetical protein
MIGKIRGRLDSLLGAGLAHVPAEELEDIAGELEKTQLGQPAAALKGIAQAARARSLEPRHLEDLIKVIQLLAQVEIKMVRLDRVEPSKLEPIGTYHGVSIEPAAVQSLLQEPLERILQVEDRYVSAYLLARYADRVKIEELEARMNWLWSNSRLIPLVVRRLRDEPAQARRLCQAALASPLRMVQRTAVRVLQAVGDKGLLSQASQSRDKLVALEARGAAPEPRLKEEVRTLAEAATKEERAAAAKRLGESRNPVYIEPLRRARKDLTSVVRADALVALGKIGDLQIADEINEDSFDDRAGGNAAAEALAELGDVRGFELLWRFFARKEHLWLATSYLKEFGPLLAERLLDSVGQAEMRKRKAFLSLIDGVAPLFRELAQRRLEKDPALVEPLSTLPKKVGLKLPKARAK